MSDNKSSYGNIFKTTFLFGFVQIFKALINIVKNKLVAILIGPEGMGLLGIYNSTLQLIQTGAGLGINQSAVRDVAEAYGSENKKRASRIIGITNKVVLLTGALGCFITLSLSKGLSNWTLGDSSYTLAYCLLSLVVGLNIINEGKQALLKGARSLRALAYASVIGSAVGLLTAVPLYYFFGTDGIVPELMIAAILTVIVTQYFVNKIPCQPVHVGLKEVLSESKPMVKMGVALMFVAFLGTATSFIINAYIRNVGGLSDVGLFSAGSYVINGYFGMVVTALMTDYYPRIAAVNQDNHKLQEELNKQSIASVIMCCPLIILFIALMPLFIELLYTKEFLPAMDYLKFGIFWTVITICSNQVDMILVAKYNTKVFLLIAMAIRICQIALCIPLYSNFGMLGLGISYGLLGVLHLSIMSLIVNRLYHIHFSRTFVKVALPILLLTVIATFVNDIEISEIKYCIIIVLVIFSIAYSYNRSKECMDIDFLTVIKNKLKKN